MSRTQRHYQETCRRELTQQYHCFHLSPKEEKQGHQQSDAKSPTKQKYECGGFCWRKLCHWHWWLRTNDIVYDQYVTFFFLKLHHLKVIKRVVKQNCLFYAKISNDQHQPIKNKGDCLTSSPWKSKSLCNHTFLDLQSNADRKVAKETGNLLKVDYICRMPNSK